jgi:hypothetical protein
MVGRRYRRKRTNRWNRDCCPIGCPRMRLTVALMALRKGQRYQYDAGEKGSGKGNEQRRVDQVQANLDGTVGDELMEAEERIGVRVAGKRETDR